jgi:hypothetical protein
MEKAKQKEDGKREIGGDDIEWEKARWWTERV